MTWADARVALLRKLCSEGFTYREIAARLGVTRSAAIGKSGRLGLKQAISGGATEAPTTLAHRIRRRARDVKRTAQREAPPLPVAPLAIPFAQRRATQCAAITDATPYEQRCCGHAVAREGAAYCRWHMALYYQRAEKAAPERRA